MRRLNELLALADELIADGAAPNGVTVREHQTSLAALRAQFADALGPFAAVQSTLIAYEQLLAARTAGIPGAQQLAEDGKAAFTALLGANHPRLLAHGLRGKGGHHVLTSEQGVAKRERARRTRSQRGTMGKRQKEKIKFQGRVEVKTTPKK